MRTCSPWSSKGRLPRKVATRPRSSTCMHIDQPSSTIYLFPIWWLLWHRFFPYISRESSTARRQTQISVTLAEWDVASAYILWLQRRWHHLPLGLDRRRFNVCGQLLNIGCEWVIDLSNNDDWLQSVKQISLFSSDFSWNTNADFVMGTGTTLLEVCPWFFLLADKFSKFVLENEKKREEKKGRCIWKLYYTSIFHWLVSGVIKITLSLLGSNVYYQHSTFCLRSFNGCVGSMLRRQNGSYIALWHVL